MYIVLAIIAFGILIAIHELGHFTAAKALNVRVKEFAIGMGPKILKKQGKETLYSLRALPFGGFCAMDEDTASDDPRAFTSQKRWRRVIILASGSLANIITAFIVIIILTIGTKGFVGTTVVELADGFPDNGASGLMAGDTIMSMNGERLYYSDDFLMFIGLAESAGNSNVNLVVRRGGEKVTLNNYPLERREYMIDGEMRLRFGITFNLIEGTAIEQLKYASYRTMNFVRLIRVSLAQLISGAAGFRDLSGPVGIVDAMNTIGQDSPTVGIALGNIAFFTAFIGVNLAIMNMLPIPALDGGRILFLCIGWVIEKILRRRIDPKYEGYIHAGAMVLLFGLMILVLASDVVKLVGGRLS